jgi:uncharacterized protein YlxP (DUF503 family)
MRVGVGRLVLDFLGNLDVNKKRRALEDLGKDLRRKFNVSILEVADLEDPERGVIGFSAVIPDHWSEVAARSFCEKICTTLDDTSPARITVEDWDILHHGDEDWEPEETVSASQDARDLIRRKLSGRRPR